MEDVFGEQPAKAETTPQGEVEETQVAEPAQVEEQQTEPSTGAPPAPHTDGQVPLAALEAERKGRQDWKEKALRLEGENAALRQQREQPAPDTQQVDPAVVVEQRVTNLLLNHSERMARKTYGDEAVNKAFEKFQAAVKANPFLGHQAGQSADPWDFVVQEAKRLELLEEIGSDPAAYKEKLKQQWLAEQQPAAPAPAPRPSIPASLATTRSAASRTAQSFTGPPSLDNLFTN